MKNSILKSFFLAVLFLNFQSVYSQVSEIEVSVNWASWASDNAVSIYDADDNLLLFVCDPNGCQTTASNSSFSTTINMGCHADANNYYVVAEDAFGDGWNGNGNFVQVMVAGNQVINYNLTSGSSSGKLFFNVSGGGSCPTTDIAIQALSGLSSGCNLTSNEEFNVVLKNQGLDTLSSVPVWYTLNNGDLTFAGTYTGTIIPGDTASLSLSINASETGTQTVNIFTVLDGDVNPSNDSVTNYSFTNSIPHNFNSQGSFTMGFEATENNSGWTVLNYNQDGAVWNLESTTAPRTGSSSAMYNYNTTNAANDWFITPCLELEAGKDYALDFYYRAMSATWPEAFEVHLMAAADSGNSLGIITSFNNITTTSYTQSLDTFTAQSSGQFYLGWKATSTADQYNLLIDDITLSKINTNDVGISSFNSPAANCSFSSVEFITVNVRNYGLNSVSGYSVSYSIDGGAFVNTGAAGTTLASGDSSTIGFYVDLSAPGSHIITAVVTLAGDEFLVNDTVEINAISQSIDFNLTSLNMGFETGEDFSSWTVLNANGDARQWQSTSINPNSGNNAYRIRNSNQAADDWLFTPCLSLDTGETYVIEFFYRARNGGYSENFEVHLTNDVTSTSSVQTLFSDQGFNHTTYLKDSVEFSVSTPGTYHIAFRSNSAANQRGIQLDDVSMYNTTNRWLGYSTNWEDATNWSNGVPSENTSVIIPSTPAGGNFPYLNASRNSGSVLIEANAQLNMNDTVKLNVKGNFNAQSNAIEGHVVMNGANQQRVKGNCNFKSLEINNTNGVTLQSGSITINEELELTNGELILNGNDLIIVSNETGDARIAPVMNGTITGDVTVQRYINAGATNWRFLASPTENGDIEQWDDNMITSGFVGADYPNFSFTSIWKYDETIAGEFNNGYSPIASSTELLSPGKGFMVWSGTGGSSTQAFTIDVKGPANIGDVTLPVTHTNSGDSTNDGWNLIGNPYASEIDWESPAWIKTNINNAIYVWDPDAAQYTSYVDGVGVNGGTQYIASGQAFWVQANGANPVLTATENVKTSTSQGFFAPEEAPKAYPLLKLKMEHGSLHDELLIRFMNNASTTYDQGLDASKVASSVATVPMIYTVTDSIQYSINSLPRASEIMEIPVYAKAGFNGTYEVSVSELINFEHIGCLMLEDQISGEVYNLKNIDSFNASFTTSDIQPRFILTVYPEVTIQTETASCFGMTDGKASISNLGNNIFSSAKISSSAGESDTITNISGALNLVDLDAGKYFIELQSTGACPSIRDTFSITSPDEIVPSFAFTMDEITNSVSLENQSIGAVSYEWEFGDGAQSDEVSPVHFYNSKGPFLLTLKAKNSFGCESQTSQVIEIPGSIKENITSVEETVSTKLSIITKGNLIQVSSNEEWVAIEQITVRDLQGRLVYSSSFSSNMVEINLSSASHAIYSIEVKTTSSLHNQLISLY